MSPFSSAVSGSILSNTSENLTFAFTQAARGAVAREMFVIVGASKLPGFALISLFT